MHVPYVGASHPMSGPPLLPMHISGSGLHPYSGHPPYLPTHPHHHPIVPPHLQPNRLNEFHVAHYETANASSLHHPNTTYAATSTSTLIAHHQQTASQSIPTSTSSVAPALSKNEFYMKQHYLQRMYNSFYFYFFSISIISLDNDQLVVVVLDHVRHLIHPMQAGIFY